MLPTADSQGGRPSRVPQAPDPDFDPPRVPRSIRLDDLWEFQRLVVNPFLAILSLIAGFAVASYAYHQKTLPLKLVALAFLVGSLGLLQFHCLDCGTTGRLSRWKVHACERVLARQRSGRPPRFWFFLNPKMQMVIWIYVLLAAAILRVIVYR